VSTRMRDLMMGGLGELRYEPTAKRIRAVLDGGAVVDSTRALLVWEPRTPPRRRSGLEPVPGPLSASAGLDLS
jgi:hypothetical protein